MTTIEQALDRLDELFGQVPEKNRAGYKTEFVRQLQRYEGQALAAALNDVLDGWELQRRPMPATLRLACTRLAPKAAPAAGGAVEIPKFNPPGRNDPRHPRYWINSIRDETLRVFAADIEAAAASIDKTPFAIILWLDDHLERLAYGGCLQKPKPAYVDITDAIDLAKRCADPRNAQAWAAGNVADAARRPADPYVEARRLVAIEYANRIDGVEPEPSPAAPLPAPVSASEFTYAEVAEKDESASTGAAIAKSPLLEDVSPF